MTLEAEIIKLAVSQGLWAVLFVALLFYVLKANEKRENRLLDCLDQMGRRYEFLSEDVKGIREDVKEIKKTI